MFVSATRLPHLLSPSRYYDPEAYQVELEAVLRSSWHVVATLPELARAGDFVTLELCQTPIQVRNFNGQLHALSNVCAHRHALISSACRGHSNTMRCQYHGWEYQANGRTGHIPAPKNFVPFDDPPLCLPTYPVAVAGQLVFVNLSHAAPSLPDFLGHDFYTLLEQRFGDQWLLALKWSPDYPANWKIPIENSLEAYHVPNVHPHTFRVDPGEQRSEHLLLPHRTAFGTSLPFSPHNRFDRVFQTLEARFVRWLGYPSTGEYWQHHVFPNLLFSFTDAISLCNCILPRGPKRTSATVRQFGRLPPRGGPIKIGIAKLWSRLTAAITKHILIEDQGIFPAIQCGLEHSQQPGILGRCEERIFRFQEFILGPHNAQNESNPTRQDP